MGNYVKEGTERTGRGVSYDGKERKPDGARVDHLN